MKQWKIVQLGSNEELERHLNQVSGEGAEILNVYGDQYPTAVYSFDRPEGESGPEASAKSSPRPGHGTTPKRGK